MRLPRLRLAFLAALAAGCSPPQADGVTTGTVSSDDDSTGFTTDVQLLRDDFARLHITAYRSRMFRLIRDVRRATVAETEQRLDVLLAEARTATDGLEALIVTHADALARRGSAAVRTRLTTKLRNAHDTAKWKWEQPYAGLLVPLGRYDTVLVVNVRSDAMREIFEGLTRHADRAALEGFLGLPDVRGDVCNLDPLGALQTALDPDAIAADDQRDEDCKNGGLKPGAAGTMRGAANGACLDVGLDAYASTDSYTIGERNADLQQCADDLKPDGKGNPLAADDASGLLGLLGVTVSAELGPAAAEAVKGYFDVVKGVGSFTGSIAKRGLEEYLKIKAEERARAAADEQAAIDAEVEAVGAIVAYADAMDATREAADELKDAQGALADRDREYNTALEQQRRGEVTQGQVDAAKQRRDEASDAAVKADANHKAKKAEEAKAKEKAAKAYAKAVEAANKVKKDQPTEPGELSPACSRLIANGHDINDPVDMKKLPEGWLEAMERFDPRTVNPNPEEGSRPSDALGLPFCGEDPASTHRSAMACDAAVDCVDESQQCGCSSAAIQHEAGLQAIARRQAAGVCMTSNCPPESPPAPVGIACICGAQEDPGEPPPPLPVTHTVIESIFMAPAAQTPIDGKQDPLSLYVREALRP